LSSSARVVRRSSSSAIARRPGSMLRPSRRRCRRRITETSRVWRADPHVRRPHAVPRASVRSANARSWRGSDVRRFPPRGSRLIAPGRRTLPARAGVLRTARRNGGKIIAHELRHHGSTANTVEHPPSCRAPPCSSDGRARDVGSRQIPQPCDELVRREVDLRTPALAPAHRLAGR
jgi:hypothetical protein